MKEGILKRLIAESHERQHNGEDYQAVAHEIANRSSIHLQPEKYPRDAEVWTELETAPSEGCDCAFCETHLALEQP